MITGILFAAIAGALIGAMRNQSGVGYIRKPRRNLYQEIMFCQEKGIDFSQPYPLSKDYVIEQAIKWFDWKRPRKLAGYTASEVKQYYYNQLQRKYKNVTAPVGAIDVEDYAVKSVVKNQNGDTAIIHYQYGDEVVLVKAMAWMGDNLSSGDAVDTDREVYWRTIYDIAGGLKFLWSSKGGERGLSQELFAHKSFGEAGLYRSIIGTKEKGATSIDKYAELLAGYNGDSMVVKDLVLEALRDVHSVSAAQQAIIDRYWQDLEEKDRLESGYYYQDDFIETSPKDDNTITDNDLPF